MQVQLAKALINEIRDCLAQIDAAINAEPTIAQMETLKCLRNVAEVAQAEVVNGDRSVELPALPPPTRSKRQRQVEEEGRNLGQRLKHSGPPAELLNPPSLINSDCSNYADWGGALIAQKAAETVLLNGVKITIT